MIRLIKIILILTITPLTSMSQNISFGKLVQQLYFDVNLVRSPIDKIISDFKKVANEYKENGGVFSLSVNFEMEVSGKGKRVTHTFIFTKSPLPNLKTDSGYINLEIGESDDKKKILDILWCFEFSKKIDAKKFFEELKNLFKSVSTIQKIGIDKLNAGEYADFSTRLTSENGIKDVSIFFGKSLSSNKYEIRIVPYNEFQYQSANNY